MASNSVYQQYPSNLSSFQYQYSNLALSFASAPSQYFPYLTSVNYSDTNDVVEARGISPYPMGTTLGEYKASGSLEVQKLYLPDFLALVANGSPDKQSLYDSVFDVVAQYQLRPATGQTQPPVKTDILHGCRITGMSQDMSQGNAVLTVKVTLYIAYITWSDYLPLAGLPQ
jgi:hypothetical protein